MTENNWWILGCIIEVVSFTSFVLWKLGVFGYIGAVLAGAIVSFAN